MRRQLLPVLALAALLAAAPATSFAQISGAAADNEPTGPDRKKDDEWESRQPALPAMRNAGPCPFVKVLYDASRYIEFEGGREASSAVGFTGEVQGVSAGCEYQGAEPIKLKMEILFALGKGPRAQGDSHTYQYWVAVTDRNSSILAKEYFQLPTQFEGRDRVLMTDSISSITIPRGRESVSGANFEVLVGFEVTPQMAAFNRDGKRFRVNAGGQAAAGTSASQ